MREQAVTLVEQVAYRLERLAPSSRDPMRFHEEKSDLIMMLHDAAHALRVLPRPDPLRGRATAGFSAVKQNLNPKRKTAG